MEQYIKKSDIVAEIERIKKEECPTDCYEGRCKLLWFEQFLSFINTLEVKEDPYELCVQYDSIEAGIQAHAETYSFNIESELFNQLTKEQQKLWREEIEQACISGGDAGYTLAKDPRYKENLEVKGVDLMIHTIITECCDWLTICTDLGHDLIEDCRNLMLAVKDEQLKAQKGE